MAKKKTKNQPKKKQVNAENVIGLHSEVTDQPITQTLEVNYMPYAMSVNVSRAFPEIDGFKPSHRKLLYTMYKMGLLKGERQKSANIVGQTMKLNPHGDAAIYETMVRLATGNEALLAPFVESKGNFGKYYSGDLSYAASRYTEAKLSPISAEIFKDIDFVVEKQGCLSAIEVKAGENTRSRSLSSLKKTHPGVRLIRLSTKPFGMNDGLMSVPLYAAFCL